MIDTTNNLKFFNEAILGPALRLREDHPHGVVGNLGAVDAASLASFGADIGYFDGDKAYELVSSSEGVFRAWSNLHDLANWAIIQEGKEGKPTLREFASPGYVPPEGGELLHNTFQTFLLMTSENIFNHASYYFLDGIGWAGDGEWNLRMKGSTVYEFSAQILGTGFASVLNYWEETMSLVEDGRRHAYFVSDMLYKACYLLQPLFNLVDSVVKRYFTLAGSFVSLARDDSLEWLDARREVFEKLIPLIKFWGGGTVIQDDSEELWNLFIGADDGSLGKGSTVRVL
jgi:hypothetical protein